MPDRSLRLLTLPPQSPQGGERSGVLLRERPASSPGSPGTTPGGTGGTPQDAGDGRDGQGGGPPQDTRNSQDTRDSQDARDDNPFAPPPEGAPDRPWQPRRPAGGEGPDGEQSAPGAQGPHGPQGGGSPWGSQWSDQQPGRSPGGFGEHPGGPAGSGGPHTGPQGPGPQGSGGPGPGTGTRWDSTDPAQRRARYALLSGMWAFFFALFSWPYVALLLGALAMYWSISALRAKPGHPDPDTPAPPVQKGRPQTTAAVSGLVTASLAIALVAAGFTVKLVYNDYYSCTNDALTNESKQSCTDLLPKELRGLLGTDN